MGKWIAGGFVAFALIYGCGQYSSYVSKQETVNEKWSQVENVYQRRADLVPNLVNTVKGYAKHERGTFEAVTQARAAATQMKIDPTNLTAEKLREFQRVQGEFGAALSRLLAVSENYPQLKADGLFRDLMPQLEGTENRIAVERREFNQAARVYNTSIRMPPGSFLIARPFSFTARPYFEAEAGAKTAPRVSFE